MSPRSLVRRADEWPDPIGRPIVGADRRRAHRTALGSLARRLAAEPNLFSSARTQHGEDGRWYRWLPAGHGCEAWLIGWPSGGGIQLHDHGGSAGALLVLEGRLRESWAARGLDDTSSVRLRHRMLERGRPALMGQGHVHDLTNPDATTALSVHVYSPPLRAMTFFAVSDQGRLEPLRREPVTGPERRQWAS